jgi:acyl carrier protein
MQWDDLVAEVVPFTELPEERIGRDTMLIEDLGLDSLALTELLIILIEEHGVDALSEELFARSWEQVTLAELFGVYCSDAAAAPAGPSAQR